MKSSDVGSALQQTAYALAPVVALVITSSELVLWINDRLAAWWVGVLGLKATAVTDIPVTPPAAPAPTVTLKPEPVAPAPKKRCRKAPSPAPAQTTAAKPRPARRARRRKTAPTAAAIAETARV